MPAIRLDLANLTATLLLVCAVCLLPGCSRPDPRHIIGPMAAVLPPQPDLCGLVRLDILIGQDFVSLADQPLVGPLRVVWPGQEITSDIVPRRLNAQVSDQGLIQTLSCG